MIWVVMVGFFDGLAVAVVTINITMGLGFQTHLVFMLIIFMMVIFQILSLASWLFDGLAVGGFVWVARAAATGGNNNIKPEGRGK